MIDSSSFSKALGQLSTSLDYLRSDLARGDVGLYRQFRAATIQAFEFSYELAVRMMRRQLREIAANPAELQEMGFMDLVRTAADAGLVRDVAGWRTFREMRNITSHAYDESKAEQVVAGIDGFAAECRHLAAELERRNRASD